MAAGAQNLYFFVWFCFTEEEGGQYGGQGHSNRHQQRQHIAAGVYTQYAAKKRSEQ